LGETLTAPLCRAVFHDHVLAPDIATLAQALPQGVEIDRIQGWRNGLQHADAPNLARLLRTRGERPRDCSATNYFDEIAPSHGRPAA
jgi:hypothetical protein